MKRLGHGAEIFAQTRGLRGAQAQRATRGFAVEPEQFCGGRGGADRTAGRRAVEAVLVMTRHDGFGDLAFDLDADLIRGHQVPAAPAIPLGDRQHWRQRGRGWMGEQSVDAILGHGELRVVVVVGVDGDSVGERCEARGKTHIASDDCAAVPGCDAQRRKIAPGNVSGLRRGARKGEADAVEHRALAEVSHVAREVLSACGDNEAGNVVGKRRIDGGSGCSG